MRKFVLFVATGAGSGLAPFAPGTFGSAVGLVLWAAWIWSGRGNGFAALLAALAITGIGVWAAHGAEREYGHDDGRIVIDEVAGMWIALVFLPVGWPSAVVAFLAFRAFDIWKPPPARAAERLDAGWGVMADDVVAGLYANLIGQLVLRGVPAWA